MQTVEDLLCGRPGYFFDIGACKGRKTELYLAMGVAVIAVEPVPFIAKALRETLAGKNAIVVEKAVGQNAGTRNIRICSEKIEISTMWEFWPKGRFRNMTWDKSIEVEVATLDALIKEFCVPAFCKIDVEGYEQFVLGGLSQPLPLLSIEYTREFLKETGTCLAILDKLGMTEFNYTVGERGKLMLPTWVDSSFLFEHLECLSYETLYGDVYARTPGTR